MISELILTLRVKLTEPVDVNGFVMQSIIEDVRDGKLNDYVDEVTMVEWSEVP